ncbi:MULTISPECIES: FG-GAP repeat protein [unclassified Streptomyces]|nr:MULTISPECIES: FG-GAP repeat protein [unclassified Streptomyces]
MPGYQIYFGSSPASGDMSRDGYADLLVGGEMAPSTAG